MNITDEDFISFIESLREPQTKAFDESTLETLGKYRYFKSSSTALIRTFATSRRYPAF